MWPFSRKPRHIDPSLAHLVEVLVVKKLEAEAAVAGAQSKAALENAEYQLRILREKEELRQQRKAAAIKRNTTYPRKRGRLQSPQLLRDGCFLCHPSPDTKGLRCEQHAAVGQEISGQLN